MMSAEQKAHDLHLAGIIVFGDKPLIVEALSQAEAQGFERGIEEAARIAFEFDGGTVRPRYDWISTKAGIRGTIRALLTQPGRER